MKLSHPSHSPLLSWLRTATWYQLGSRFLTVSGPEDKAAMAESMEALRVALGAEAEALTELYAAGKTVGNRRVAQLIPEAWAEVQAMSVEGEPAPGIGSLQGWADWPAKIKTAWKWIATVGGSILGLFVLAKIGPTVWTAIKKVTETEEEKERRKADAAFLWLQKRNERMEKCIEDCGADNAACIRDCRDAVQEIYEAYGPSSQECGMLDTPAGTSLGAISGLMAGYVAGEYILGKVE